MQQADIELLPQLHAPAHIARDDAGGQAVIAVVGQFHGLCIVGKRNQHSHRAEDFFVKHRIVFRHAREHRRPEKHPLRIAAGFQPRTVRHRSLHQVCHPPALFFIDQGADGDIFLRGVAHHQLAGFFGNARFEALINGFLHQNLA